jgi:hypothetical protein
MNKYITKIEKLVAERMNSHSKPTGKGLLAKPSKGIPSKPTKNMPTDDDMMGRIADYVHDIRMMRTAIKDKVAE